MNKHPPTHSPKDTDCAKCDQPIATGQGRRFRMKWYHENCLPETRIKQLQSFRTEESALIGEKYKIQREIESLERVKKKLQAHFGGK